MTASHCAESNSRQMKHYVQRQVAPALREAFQLMMTTQMGQELGRAAWRRRGRFMVDPTPWLGTASITFNFLRVVIIGGEIVKGNQLISLVESIAHEASHLAQGYWSDSFQQEYQAFVSAACVLHELGYQDSFGWTPELWELPLEAAARRMQQLFPEHPLYGQRAVIPLEQKRGWRTLWPLFKQAWALAQCVPPRIELCAMHL